MPKNLKANFVVVDLADCIKVRTEIPKENHAALRSGFAGFPFNPRWSSSKLRAWKTGGQLRKALAQGKIAVRSTDLLLVPVNKPSEVTASTKQPILARQLINFQPI